MQVREMSEEMLQSAKAMGVLVDAVMRSWRIGLSKNAQDSINDNDIVVLRNKLVTLLVNCSE